MYSWLEKFFRSNPKVCKFILGRICPKCDAAVMSIITSKYEECIECGYRLYKV